MASNVAPNPLLASDICVVIVTYGDRYHLLSQVVERALDIGFGSLVIVFNGNFDAVKAPSHPNLTNIRIDQNLGSAGGYKVGIEAAMSLGSPYLLLLDDDNLLSKDCLLHFSNAHRQLGGTSDICLYAYRKNLEWHRLLIQHGVQTIALPNTYAWFHIRNARHLMLRQLGLTFPKRAMSIDTPTIRESTVACYGGLLLSRTLILKAGLPDPQFFCYYDDFDYTNRLRSVGAHLYLCSTVQIEDIEESWHIQKGQAHPLFSSTVQDDRIFLDLRNSIFLCQKRIDNRAIYEVNRVLFWLGITYLALFRSSSLTLSLRRLPVVLRAVISGSKSSLSETS